MNTNKKNGKTQKRVTSGSEGNTGVERSEKDIGETNGVSVVEEGGGDDSGE
jgi:hypothetical protein